MSEQLKIIYILGSGHSGSTLLDLLLGSHSHIESVGEVFKYFDFLSDESTRPEEKRFCTCGKHIKKCEYWGKVRNDIASIYGQDAIELRTTDSKKFIHYNYDLIQSILNISGKRYFCDSSKDFIRLKQFWKSDLFDVYTIFLVRDARAVSYSSKRKGYNLYVRSLKWNIYNIWCYINLKTIWKNKKHIFIKYEEFSNNPEKYLRKILEDIDLAVEETQFKFWEYRHHNLAGNRMKLNKTQTIKLDLTYIGKLSFMEWLVGTLFSFTGLKLFGYPIRRKK